MILSPPSSSASLSSLTAAEEAHLTGAVMEWAVIHVAAVLADILAVRLPSLIQRLRPESIGGIIRSGWKL